MTMRLLASLTLVLMMGCNTMQGLGKDIQKGGEKVSQAASSVQKKI